jgi:hypothetical protein
MRCIFRNKDGGSIVYTASQSRRHSLNVPGRIFISILPPLFSSSFGSFPFSSPSLPPPISSSYLLTPLLPVSFSSFTFLLFLFSPLSLVYFPLSPSLSSGYPSLTCSSPFSSSSSFSLPIHALKSSS